MIIPWLDSVMGYLKDTDWGGAAKSLWNVASDPRTLGALGAGASMYGAYQGGRAADAQQRMWKQPLLGKDYQRQVQAGLPYAYNAGDTQAAYYGVSGPAAESIRNDSVNRFLLAYAPQHAQQVIAQRQGYSNVNPGNWLQGMTGGLNALGAGFTTYAAQQAQQREQAARDAWRRQISDVLRGAYGAPGSAPGQGYNVNAEGRWDGTPPQVPNQMSGWGGPMVPQAPASAPLPPLGYAPQQGGGGIPYQGTDLGDSWY